MLDWPAEPLWERRLEHVALSGTDFDFPRFTPRFQRGSLNAVPEILPSGKTNILKAFFAEATGRDIARSCQSLANRGQSS
jgi:hypothetical protein